MTGELRYKSLGKHLRQLRLRGGWETQRRFVDDLSKEAGMAYSDALWSKMERGERRPNRDLLVAVCAMLARRGVLTTRQEANELFILAGHPGLSSKEALDIGLVEETGEKDASKRRVVIAQWPPPPARSVGVAFAAYIALLEVWRNMVWARYHIPDENWASLLLCIPGGIAAWYAIRRWGGGRTSGIALAAIGFAFGLAPFLGFHRPGIITLVLNILGGLTWAAVLIAREEVVTRPRTSTALILISLFGVMTMIYVYLTMYIILFMSPPNTWPDMPYEVRVLRGGEIALSLLINVAVLIWGWFLPLFRRVSI